MSSGVVNGLATVGRMETYFGTAVGGLVIVLFIICCVWLGISMLRDRRTAKTTGTSSAAPTCTANGCDGTANYSVQNVSYSVPYHTSTNPGQSALTVYYNPTNPADAIVNKPGATIFFVIASGLFVLLISLVVQAVFVSKSKYYAAATGAGDLAGMAADIF